MRNDEQDLRSIRNALSRLSPNGGEYCPLHCRSAHLAERMDAAIYANETPKGFIMTHTGSGYEDGINCPGVFLWRRMISGTGRERDTADIIFKQHLSNASFDIIKYDVTDCKDYAKDHTLVDEYKKLASPGGSRKSFPDAAH